MYSSMSYRVPYSLKTANPTLALQWHPTKNGALTASDVMPGSRRIVWWFCSRGHEWQRSVEARNTGRGCPFCRNLYACLDNCLQTLRPDLAKEWHPTKNGNLTPRDVTPGSKKEVWWLCPEKHEWLAPSCRRNKGMRCPVCVRPGFHRLNRSRPLSPQLIKEWHPRKNDSLIPSEVTAGSAKKAWWLCSKGHEWLARIGSRSYGRNCPFCGGRFAANDHCLESSHPELAMEWHPKKNKTLLPSDVTPMSGKKVWWRCKKGHSWKAFIYNRSRGNGCRKCLPVHWRALSFVKSRENKQQASRVNNSGPKKND
jgi:hypothetical protein